jgi:hypothetical protein
LLVEDFSEREYRNFSRRAGSARRSQCDRVNAVQRWVERAFLDDVLQGTLVLMVKLTGLSSHSQQIVVPNSGHLIPFEQPPAVVDAIQRVFDMCSPFALSRVIRPW